MKYRQVTAMLALSAFLTGSAAFSPALALAEEAEASEEMDQEILEQTGEALVEEATAPDEGENVVSEDEHTAPAPAAAETKKEKTADAEGLIEDTGVSVSKSEGNTLEEELQKELEEELQKVRIPGFMVDPLKYPPANITENTRQIYWYLREVLELNHAAACGVLANIQMEANFRPIALGDGGTSYGICQWHLGRFMNLMNFCKREGLDYNTLEGQLAYLRYELETGYKHVYELISEVEDTGEGAYTAAYIFCLRFEMPDQTEARSEQRGHLAEEEYFEKEFEELTEEEDEYFLSIKDWDSELIGMMQLLPKELDGAHMPGTGSESFGPEEAQASETAGPLNEDPTAAADELATDFDE